MLNSKAYDKCNDWNKDRQASFSGSIFKPFSDTVSEIGGDKNLCGKKS